MNEEIVGGIRTALERGETLKRAMMTFFNAGYKREEIEEAAKFVNENPNMPSVSIAAPVEKQKQGLFWGAFNKKIPERKIISSEPVAVPQAPISSNPQPVQQVVSNYGEKKLPQIPTPVSKPTQIVSNYGGVPIVSQPMQNTANGTGKPKDKFIIIVLVVLLFFLLGLLASIFLFKTEIINFFSNMVS
jgi:hypothetical protein